MRGDRVPPMLFVLFFAGLFIVGCSKQDGKLPVYPVTGTVTYQNNPVEGATVIFSIPGNKQAKAATGLTDSQGRFTLSTYSNGDGAAAGEHQVTVTKYTGGGGESNESLTMEQAAKQAEKKDSSQPASKSELPLKYSEASTSELKFTVSESGENHFEIKLK